MAGPFQTPQNEKSFSGLCDQVIIGTGRSAALLDVIAYANATLRECHALGLFYRDLIEDQLLVGSSTGSQIWEPGFGFRKLRTVQYDDSKIYPKYLLPGRQQRAGENTYDSEVPRYYYYAADNYFVFNGVSLSENINYAAYWFPKSFQYYTRLGATNTAQLPGSGYSTRSAYFDKDDDLWKYLNATGDAYLTTLGDPTVEAARRAKTMNWMVADWYELIMEGTKNKIFNLYGDTRTAASYSMYKSQQKDLVNSSQFESEGV